MTRYAIGLGSNLGDRRRHLAGAVAELSEELGELTISPIYETEPVGGPEQAPFLNAVVVVATDRPAIELLDLCQQIEQAHGRVREEQWGPRTLDLDILASDAPPHSGDRLEIPHPRAVEREFVLRPLSDVWPEAPVGHGLTAREALGMVQAQGVDFLSDDWIPPGSRLKANTLLAGQLTLIGAVAAALVLDGSFPDVEATTLTVIGAAVAVLGAGVATVAARSLGRSMSAGPLPKPGAELVVTGPYRHARHPIYGGLILFLMGVALAYQSPVGFLIATALIPYLVLKATYEERQLRLRHSGYSRYKRAVRPWFFPFLA